MKVINGKSVDPLFNRMSFVAPEAQVPLNAASAFVPKFKFVVTLPEVLVELMTPDAAVMLPLAFSLIANADRLSEPLIFKVTVFSAETGALMAMPVPAPVDVEVIVTEPVLDTTDAAIRSVVPFNEISPTAVTPPMVATVPELAVVRLNVVPAELLKPLSCNVTLPELVTLTAAPEDTVNNTLPTLESVIAP